MHKNDFDLGIKHIHKHDKVLSSIIRKYGNRNLTPQRKYFNLLLSAIISQQLSVKAAAAIEKRFMNHFKNKPSPENVLATDDLVLRGFGLSNAKVKYVKDLSEKILTGQVKLKGLSKKGDSAIIEELTKVKGIGVWSAHMFLIFNLGRINILPTGDLGIRKAVMLNYHLKKMPTEEKVVKIAAKNNWHPYCTVASIYLWHSLDNK